MCCLLFAPETLLVSGARFGFSSGILSPTRGGRNVPGWIQSAILLGRGGDQEQTLSLDEKVQKAMEKLGIEQPNEQAADDCKDGVCPMPTTDAGSKEDAPPATDVHVLANQISKDMNVDEALVMAALGATSTDGGPDGSRKYNEDLARTMIQQELDVINTVPEDSKEVSWAPYMLPPAPPTVVYSYCRSSIIEK